MQQRPLDHSGIEVSALGLGYMGMSWVYSGRNDEESIRVIHHAIEHGVTFLTPPISRVLLLTRSLSDGQCRDIVTRSFLRQKGD